MVNRWGSSFSLVFITLFLGVIGIYIYNAPQQQAKQGSWVTHTHEVLAELATLSKELVEVRKASRAATYDIYANNLQNPPDITFNYSAAQNTPSDTDVAQNAPSEMEAAVPVAGGDAASNVARKMLETQMPVALAEAQHTKGIEVYANVYQELAMRRSMVQSLFA